MRSHSMQTDEMQQQPEQEKEPAFDRLQYREHIVVVSRIVAELLDDTIGAAVTVSAANAAADATAAKAVQSIGLRQPPEDLDPAELASWTAVARTILNLHESITRQ